MPWALGCASGLTLDTAEGSGADTSQSRIEAWKKSLRPADSIGNCAYPTENRGTARGEVPGDNLTWEGYVDGSPETSQIGISEYYDCAAARGINALLVVQSATWCGLCQEEAGDIDRHMSEASGWRAKGIEVLTLMIEDIDGSPANVRTALNWRNQFKLNTSTVAADPAFSFVDRTSDVIGLPEIIVIDPRTMEVIDVQQGYSGDHTLLEQVAARNANR
jgi:hypothetical protein